MITRGLIEGWLRDMGLQPREVRDPGGSWRYSFCMPPGQMQNSLDVAGSTQMLRAIRISVRTLLSPLQRAALIALSADAARRFRDELIDSLSKQSVQYALEADGDADLSCIEVSALRFDDGLTLDSFAHTVHCVFTAQTMTLRCLGWHLGNSTGGLDSIVRRFG